MPETLHIASYNVHRCVGLDARCDPDRIARVIAELAVDVIALQEVYAALAEVGDLHQVNYLARRTGLTAIPGPTIRRPDSHYGNVLLTRHPVRSLHHHDLSVPGCEPRGAIDAVLDLRGLPVRVVATHLGLGPRERRWQARQLLGHLGAPHPDPGTDPPLATVLLGDLNEWFPRLGTLGWFRHRFGAAPAPATFPSPRPFLALDRLWVAPRSALTSLWVHTSPRARVASDHLPLRATLTVSAPG